MTLNLKNVLVTLVFVALSALQFGCGEDGETSTPAVQLNSSTVVSSTVSSHLHAVSVPFVDVSALPVDGGYQYRSDTAGGHSHVIALSKQQIIDLNNGMQMTLTSSTPSSGAGHAHTWSILGGSVLYDKHCYNCHSNNKRNQTPMNVVFNASQSNAVKAPGSAPLSTSAAATPDPNYTLTSTTPDGAALYAGACASCHGTLASSTKSNRSALQIRAAINAAGTGMSSLSSLTDVQLQAIATALVKL
ncbi:MAG: cytochrome c [Verrucomicrobia bacterium]|nr:cytochrome c [Deltaproteobacteria bacterium]